VLASFYTLLYCHRMRREGEHKISCVPSCKGKFDVRSFYNILAIKEATPFPWKSIWCTKAPSRVFIHFNLLDSKYFNLKSKCLSGM
jgi:hypothetical protein